MISECSLRRKASSLSAVRAFSALSIQRLMGE
jgi:hypothetical protein